MSLGVHTSGSLVTTVHLVITLVYIHALFLVVRRLIPLVAWLALAIIPAGHINALGGVLVTSVQSGCALVQILFTGRAYETHTTRTEVGGHALAAVQTAMLTHSWRRRKEEEEIN